MGFIWRPFTQMQTAARRPPFVSQGKKALLILKDGRKIIDAVSSWWVVTHGHCTPSIVRAVQKQAELLDQALFADFTHAPAEALADEITSLLPENLNKVFFSDNGSTAVEAALKMAIQSMRQRGERKRDRFIAFSASYHGDTCGAMSVSGRSIFTKPHQPLLFPVIRARQGRYSFDDPSAYYKNFEEKLNREHHRLAGVIIEPLIQGAGGMIVWPKTAVERVMQLAREAGLYIIFDEVMTGFGRTGALFAFQQLRFAPDILCLSKGLTGGFLPLALTVTGKKIYESFLFPEKEKAFLHGHSFTGNPISSAAAAANLRLFKRKKKEIIKKWRLIARIHKERGERLRSQVKDVRRLGLVAAVEKDGSGYQSGLSALWTKEALKMGVFLRPLGDTVYILPPYSITEKELHKVWDVVEKLVLRA